MASISNADKTFADAMRSIQPNLLSLRFAADWEAATPLFEKAGRHYKVRVCIAIASHWLAQACQDHHKAMASFERAAEGQLKLGSAWHAGKDWEAAADAAQRAQRADLVQQHTAAAVEAYLQVCVQADMQHHLARQASRPHAAADAAAKGARLLQSHDDAAHRAAAYQLYSTAIDLIENHGHAATAGDLFRQATAALVHGGRMEDASLVLLRFAAACDPTIAALTMQKCYLSAVVVLLGGGDFKGATATYQVALLCACHMSQHRATGCHGRADVCHQLPGARR